MTGIFPASAQIRLVYKKSLYKVGSIKIKIDHYPQNIPDILKKKTLVLFSAYNPGGRLKAEGWNKRMMQNLRAYLKRYQYFEGAWSLRNVSEPLFMVVMPPAKAKVLARKFRQNAMVIVRDQRYSRLYYLA